jgi:hypothetical protein
MEVVCVCMCCGGFRGYVVLRGRFGMMGTTRHGWMGGGIGLWVVVLGFGWVCAWEGLSTNIDGDGMFS